MNSIEFNKKKKRLIFILRINKKTLFIYTHVSVKLSTCK